MFAHKRIPSVVSIGCLLFNQCGVGMRQGSSPSPLLKEDAGLLLALAEAPTKARVAILGNVDTGKSTLCQWLLARTDVCAVTGVLTRTTTTELATGHWFGNPANGELEVLDTPGFLLDGSDGVDFIQLVNEIKAMGEIDAIIMTSSLSGETGSFRFKTMTSLRHTFGSAMWENMVHFLKVNMGWSSGSPYYHPGLALRDCGEAQCQTTPPLLENHLEYWSGTFRAVEFNESTNKGVNWADAVHAEALKDLEADIASASYQRTFGARLIVNTQFLTMQAADDLQNPPYNDFQKITSGVGDDKYGLVPLRNEILKMRANREGGGQWDVKNLRARFGPSSVTAGQSFECKWPHPCNMTIQGDYLSDADRVRIFPKTHTCGAEFTGFGAEVVPVSHNEARPRLGDAETAKFFDMGATIEFEGGKKEYKVCYCEYGNCDGDQRYHQEVGALTVEDTKCPVACTDEATLHATLKDGTCGDGVFIRPGKDPLTYECSTGYGINGYPQLKTFTQTCDAHSATLTPISPCPIVQCRTPPAMENTNSHRITATVENMVYVYKQPLLFQCNSYEGDYEAKKLANPQLEEEPTMLGPIFTVDANPAGTQRIDITCGALGEWEFPAEQAAAQTLATFVADGGCRRWKAEDFGDCTATCGKGTYERPVTCDPTPGKCVESAKPTSTKNCTSFAACPDCGATAPDLSKVHAKRAFAADTGKPDLQTEGEPVVYTCDFHNGYNLDGSGKNSYSLNNFQVACKIDADEGTTKLEWTKYSAPYEMDPEEIAKGCRKWETTPWSDCSVTCGSGHRSRKVQCSTLDDNDCAADAKPKGVVLSRNCFVSEACEIGEEALTDGKGAGVKAALGWMFVVPVLVLLGRAGP